MLKTLVGVIVLLAPVAEAQPLAVASGTALTFSLVGSPLQPGPTRRGPIGATRPAAGEITIGLAPAGNAVGVAKLHVYERASKPIDFKATAMRDGKALATESVCGRLDMDAWVTFPAETQTARLTGFATSQPGCRR